MNLEQLRPGDVAEISGAVLELANAAERIAHTCFGHDSPAGSVAAAWEADRLNERGTWRGTHPVTSALRSLAFTEFAAFDHMRTFATGLQAKSQASVSLATVTRGAIEAFARVNYVLVAGTAREVMKRFGALETEDLKYVAALESESNAPALTFWNDGKKVGVSQLIDRIDADLKAIGIPRKGAPARTALVRQLLDSALGETGGQVRYSTISAVAHSEGIAVNAFLTQIPVNVDAVTGDTIGLRVPRDFAIDYALFLTRSCAHVQDELVTKFNPLTAEADRWQQVKDRTLARVRKLTLSR